MQNVGKILLKAIINGYWCKIEYVNKGGETTNFMIAIKDIYPNKKLLKCDAFNVVYNYNTEERSIYFAQIKNIELHENATYDKPLALIEKIRQEPELYNFLDATINKDDLLDYYRDCFKLDTIPYISKYGLIPGIDDDTVKDAISIEEALPKFIAFIEDLPLVAHNSRFDLSFIEENILKLGLPMIKNTNIEYERFYDLAIVSDYDKIIPPKNQIASHKNNNVSLITVPYGHYLYYYFASWDEILKCRQTINT